MANDTRASKRPNSPGASDASDGPSDTDRKFREIKISRQGSMTADALFCEYKRDVMRKNEGKHIAPNLAGARKSAATISGTDTPSTRPNPAPTPMSTTPTLPTTDWQLPKNTVKDPNQKAHRRRPVSTSNSFAQLSDDNDSQLDNMDHDGDSDIGITPTLTLTQQEKTARPPPIYIKAKFNDIINLLTEGDIQTNKFLINQSTHDCLSISARTMPLYGKIVEILKNKGTLYYTYTPKNLWPKTLVLKGIHGNFKEEEILKEIKELNIPNTEVIKVSRFQFDKNQAQKSHHLVQLSNNSELSDIVKIKSLAYQRVKWENLKKPKLFQCRRCQRLGHANSNCNLPYGCVKCAQNHEIGKCPITKEADKAALKCANCGNTGHTASYKGCPYLKFASDLKKQTSTKHKKCFQQKVNRIYWSTTANLSYANAAQSPANIRFSQVPQFHINRRSDPPLHPSNNHPPASDDFAQEIFSANDRPPRWAHEFQQRIMTLITEQLKVMNIQITANSSRIDFLFNSLYQEQ